MRLAVALVLTFAMPALADVAPMRLNRSKPAKKEKKMDSNGIPTGEGPLYAAFETSAGRVVVRLYEQDAPKTVANFVGLATGAKEWRHPLSGERRKGVPFYDGTTFHRTIRNFMIQGGDRLSHADGNVSAAGTGDPGYRFADEFKSSLRFDRPGLLAMANSGPNSNGSQFFITEVATPHLDQKHTIFGEVVDGFERVPKIARASSPVTLQRVVISRGKF